MPVHHTSADMVSQEARLARAEVLGYQSPMGRQGTRPRQGTGPFEFPTTRHSVVYGLSSADTDERSRSLRHLAQCYWKPIYQYIRLRYAKEPGEAEEITQDFFLRCVDRRVLVGYDASRSRFRTFVRVCVDHLVFDHARRKQAQKRGGRLPLQLDFAAAEAEMSEMQSVDDPEQLFERAWVHGLLSSAIDALRQVCKAKSKEQHFRIFARLHLDDDAPTYGAVAAELGISVTDVTNRINYARRELRAIVLTTLRELCGSEQELHDEARLVLGVEL
jgi:RNA polymerase sigma factor (sigma-70 family)